MLHPQVKALLEALASSGAPTLDKLSIAEARKVYRDRCIGARTETPEVARVEALDASGPNGSIPLRIYRGIGTRRGDRLPVLVYFHGGGWSTGDLETHDGLCRALANTANCAVAAVAYRLAPEYPFPIPFEDALAATRWVHSEADRLLLDRTRMAVGGDSAGGTLAAAVAIAARDSGVRLVFQLLIYPATDHRHDDYPSYHRYANGHLLTRSLVVKLQ